MEPKFRHPECPDVHLGVCAKCRRLYERDEARRKLDDEVSSIPVKTVVAGGGIDPRAIDENGHVRAIKDSSPEEGEGAPGAVDTAETARADRGSGAPTEAGVASGPLTPAERQAKRRALLKADPEKWAEYLKRDRERKRDG